MAKNNRIPPTNVRSIDDIVRQQSVPPNIEWDPDNPMEVNACSGHSEVHAPHCEGNCPKLQMDEYDIKIENERREWARVGMDMQQYSTNLLRVDVQIQTIIKVLEDKFGVTTDEFNAVFKPKMLEHMTGVRTQFQEQVKSARTRSNIVVPGVDPTTLQ